MCWVYILQSEKTGQFYKGQTSDLTDRLRRHNAGYEKSTASARPWKLVWSTSKPSRGEAVALERKLKNLNRERTLAFIIKYVV